ncbi:MAG TPA: HI1506-related protein [Cellvibrio sp.]|nr:HI1506-related protein [Cellvibrio sp.]
MAAKKASEGGEIPALFISSRGESFRRCGFRFNKEPTGIALDCLSDEQIATLKADPNLVVEEGAALLEEIDVNEAP